MNTVTRMLVTGGGLAALLLGLAACDGGRGPDGAEADGRVRLDINNSYGEFGDYVVHINAMTTAGLTPEIARNYDIQRSENSGLINLVVLQETADIGASQPVKARVKVSAANLTGQLKTLELREIVDGPSIYYIGVVSIDDRETINFDFDVVPDGSNENLTIRFTHKFYEK